MNIIKFSLNASRCVAVAAVSVAVGCTWIAPVSVGTDGEQSNQQSLYFSRISADGRYIAFSSEGDNLVDADTNGVSDVFLRDVLDETTSRLSVASDAGQANGRSYVTGISGDGRYVVFFSEADNLVVGDSNDSWDVFLHDSQTGTTQRVSIGNTGAEADGDSTAAVVSADGRYIAFESDASNLVANELNPRREVYVRDLVDNTTVKVSVDSEGSEGESGSYICDISADGRYVGFHSFSTNLVTAPAVTSSAGNVFLHDQLTGETSLVSADAGGNPSTSGSFGCSLSADAQEVAFESMDVFFPGDPRVVQDIYVKNMQTGVLEKISVGADGNPPMESSYYPSISLDGRYVTFQSSAENLTDEGSAGGIHIYARDRQTGQTSQLSKNALGAANSDKTVLAAVSENGRYVSFLTDSSTLFADDTNGVSDVVVRAVHTLSVDGIAPSNLPIGVTTSITMTGSNFLPGTLPVVNGGDVSNVVIVDENTITLDVTVPATTEPGSQRVLALLFAPYGPPGQVIQGSAAMCDNCVSYY